LRLAVEVTTCQSLRTGIGYYTEHLVDALLQTRASGDELVLLSNRPPAPALAKRWADNLLVEGNRIRAAWMQIDAPRLLDACAADVAAFPNYIVPLASPCPTITFVHDLALLRMPELFTLRKRLMMRPLLRQSVAAASAVATVSQASQRDIVELLGVPPEKIALLPGAAHPFCGDVPEQLVTTVRSRHRLERPYVLTVGTLEPRKNLLTLLSAFDLLQNPERVPHLPRSSAPSKLGGSAREMLGRPELDLVVVGGRGWRDKRLVRELGARQPLGHVRWLGYVGERELVALYAGAELFIYPSRLEGFGLPVLEAMACGTPVVASDVPALREVAGDAARLVPPGDAEKLAAAVSSLLSDPAAAQLAREQGRQRAGKFSWTRTAEKMWRLAHETGATRLRRGPRPAVRPETTDLSAALPLGAPPRGLDARQWGLLATVAYADLFNAPLSIEDAARACICTALEEDDVVRIARSPALEDHLTLHPSGQLVLAGREELIPRQLDGASKMASLIDRHRRTLGLLAALPFVRMLAFSGGTAHQNPGARPDIDLFVVTAGKHAFTAYALLFLATKLTRTRGIVCPNYLVDESELQIAYHHDLFTAHQLVSARPISGEATYLAFCRANQDWVADLFPGFRPVETPPGTTVGRPTLQRIGEAALAPLASPLERLFRFCWRLRLRRRAARARRPDVVLAGGILKLHLSDYRRRVLDRFARRLTVLRSRVEGNEPAGGDGPDERQRTGAPAARS
jgi:glycosyltransferase involved in cell wall biosynthesis